MHRMHQAKGKCDGTHVGFRLSWGIADNTAANFDLLRPYCDYQEHFYCDGWSGPVPPDWDLKAESTMYKMFWTAMMPSADPAPEAQELGPGDAERAVALAELTRPGPFGPRTVELGEYFGYFDRDHLIAMAGERMVAGGFREISGVRSHPDYQGRGLARKLMVKLIRRQLQRNETPFLHVMSDNVVAHEMYLRMGFIDHRESIVRVISPQ